MLKVKSGGKANHVVDITITIGESQIAICIKAVIPAPNIFPVINSLELTEDNSTSTILLLFSSMTD